jgi:hypothetical protein
LQVIEPSLPIYEQAVTDQFNEDEREEIKSKKPVLLLKMRNEDFAWPRFWHRRDRAINLDHYGYLMDPAGEYPGNPDVFPFDDLATIPFLILLGGQGIGKSHSLKLEYDKIRKDAARDCRAYWFDLRVYTETRLYKRLPQSGEFNGWLEDKHDLHLFLDSLDECQLKIPNILDIIIDELKYHSNKKRSRKLEGRQRQESTPVTKKKLFLRVVCRTARWDPLFDQALYDLYTTLNDGEVQPLKEVVQTYELAPLRRVDVANAAGHYDIDEVAFLHEIEENGLVILAVRPIELNGLLEKYEASRGQFPSTQIELYLDHCKRLCADGGRTGSPGDQSYQLTTRRTRLAIAARIAAITIFSGRLVNNSMSFTGDIGGDLTLGDISGGSEYVEEEPFAVSEEAIRETLRTGLFSVEQADVVG